ncbi:CLUMA_CG000907, isoform A [Clunio marinus]|uniref:CLUMA_CG000907, isoform A n=1 Tax=Clunio marinus TaxID=568069 RepID=A0A1J1HGE3_9DIPT|nr:CLUMA_CG000907, isoform A [Clunio marinus]
MKDRLSQQYTIPYIHFQSFRWVVVEGYLHASLRVHNIEDGKETKHFPIEYNKALLVSLLIYRVV